MLFSKFLFFLDYDFERQRVFKRIPAYSYLATTNTEGDRVYMKLLDDKEVASQVCITLDT